jgi:environmental stress-induced protein Ves
MWLNDRNSVWKNDSGLTQKVLVMPLEVKTLE